ncbi:Polyadenylate-binding protein, cytoplasmic and nuclear [Dictyocoela muelleri]|nr:Polyadenylate-binding protein, cytoplasmic and nuclear [Dictyocoela muelleri]
MEQNAKTTIYVGDLSITTFESDLYKLFSEIGNIINIKLIKPDFEKQKSGYNTCYAYITFETVEEAREAIQKMNFYKMNGIEMRVMFYDKRITATKSGNVLVSNLDEKIDNKTLYNTFSVFGDILSCKVVVDNNGKSRGFGFVQFTTNVAAKKAILYGNGSKCGSNEITVVKYDKEKTAKKKKEKNIFTNLYMKNFPLNITENDLRLILEKYGKITSLHIPLNANGNVKGFAFVNFESADSAKLAVDTLHDTYPFPDVIEAFYIQPAQPKSQRAEELRRSIEQLNLSGQTYKRNLYVTNIPISYTEKDILDIFSQYGTITSIRYNEKAPENAETKFAFICYKTPDEACIAVEKANGMEIEGLLLRVEYYKSKQDMIREKSQEIQDISQFIYSSRNDFFNKKPENLKNRSNNFYNQVYNVNKNFNMTKNNNSGINSNFYQSYKGINRRPNFDSCNLNLTSPNNSTSSINNSRENNSNIDLKKAKIPRTSDDKMGRELYNLILTMAPSFKEKYSKLGIKDEKEFAEEIFDILMERSPGEVKNMIGLGNILKKNISDVIEGINISKK